MHRPERWGYVQFSTAEPGQAAFRLDPAAAIRDRLMQIYYAQNDLLRAEQEMGGVAATSLKLPAAPGLPQHTTSLRLTPEGYEAAITSSNSGEKPETWTIRAGFTHRPSPSVAPGKFARLDIPVRSEIARGDRGHRALGRRLGA